MMSTPYFLNDALIKKDIRRMKANASKRNNRNKKIILDIEDSFRRCINSFLDTYKSEYVGESVIIPGCRPLHQVIDPKSRIIADYIDIRYRELHKLFMSLREEDGKKLASSNRTKNEVTLKKLVDDKKIIFSKPIW